MLKATLKQLYLILGIFFLIMALIGIMLPVLPTTPFALLALFFFDRSSPRFHQWCLRIPVIGRGIEDWQEHRVIRIHAKIQSTILIIVSSYFIVTHNTLTDLFKAIIILILISVLGFLLSRDSKPRSTEEKVDTYL